jgi:hypothetical protein
VKKQFNKNKTAERKIMNTKTKEELEAMNVGELRTLIRDGFAEGNLFNVFESKIVSTFVNFGKKDALIEAILTDNIPVAQNSSNTATAEIGEAAEEQVAPQRPAADLSNPMAFVQAAIDKAYADGMKQGRAKAVADVKPQFEEKIAELEKEKLGMTQRLEFLESQQQANSGSAAPELNDDGTPKEGATGTVDIANIGNLAKHGGLPVLSTGRIGGIEIPKPDKFFVMDKTSLMMLDDQADMSLNEGKPKGVLFVGPAGCGKSSLPEQWSSLRGRPFYKVNAALLREAKEWFGQKSVLNGNLYFIMSEFCKALETKNCTVMVDEINRAVLQALHSLLGVLDSGKTYVEELGRHVICAKGVVVCASMNEGAQYNVHELDTALKDRFGIRVECTYLEEKDEVTVVKNKADTDEATARKMVLLADTIRKKNADASGMGGTLHETLSTRQVIEAAKMFKRRGKASLEYTITNRFSKIGGRDSEQCQVAQMIQGIFG